MMIKKIAITSTIILLLFVNPLKFDNGGICTNIPFLSDQCIGYSSKISLDDLGD